MLNGKFHVLLFPVTNDKLLKNYISISEPSKHLPVQSQWKKV